MVERIALLFVVFDDDGGGFNAVEGKYSLMVVGRNDKELKKAIKRSVLVYFGPSFAGTITIRKFIDEVIYIE